MPKDPRDGQSFLSLFLVMEIRSDCLPFCCRCCTTVGGCVAQTETSLHNATLKYGGIIWFYLVSAKLGNHAMPPLAATTFFDRQFLDKVDIVSNIPPLYRLSTSQCPFLEAGGMKLGIRKHHHHLPTLRKTREYNLLSKATLPPLLHNSAMNI
jgi:hypothetical protein